MRNRVELKSLHAPFKKGRALLGAQSKHGSNGDVWIIIPVTKERITNYCRLLTHSLILQPAKLGCHQVSGTASDGCSVCVC